MLLVEFDLAEESDARAGDQRVGIAFAMEPAGQQIRAAAILHSGFKKAGSATAEASEFGFADTRQHHGFLAGREFSDSFDVAAVFVAERRVVENVRHCEHGLSR